MANFNRYIGVGVGAVIGGYTQSPSDNPFSSTVGASIGGILGNHFAKEFTKEFKNYTKRINKPAKSARAKYNFKAPSTAEIKESKFSKIMGNSRNEFWEKIDSGKVSQGNAIKMMKAIHKKFGIEGTNWDEFEFNQKNVGNVYDNLYKKLDSVSVDTLRVGERIASTYSNDLTSTRFKNIPRIKPRFGNTRLEKVGLLTKAYQEHGLYSKEEATARAEALTYLFGDRQLKVNYIRKGDKIVPYQMNWGPGLDLPLTYKKQINLPWEKDPVTIKYITGKSDAVVRPQNRFGAVWDSDTSEVAMHDINFATGEVGDRSWYRITAERKGDPGEKYFSLTRGFDPEEMLIQEARILGRPLKRSEFTHAFERIKSSYDHNATSSKFTEAAAGLQINFNNPYRPKKLAEGEIETKLLDRETDFRIEQALSNTYGFSATRGSSINHPGTYSNGRTQWTSADSLPSGEHNPIATHIREIGFMDQEEIMKGFAGTKLAYLDGDGFAHANMTTNVNVSDEMARLIANKFGAKYSIDDGSAIVHERVNNKRIFDNYVKRTATLAYIGENNVVLHNFKDKTGESLLTDAFFTQSREERLKILKDNNLETFGHGTILGLDENLLPETLGSYADKGVIQDITKTEAGIKVVYHAQSKPKEWVKIFSQFFKSGDALARDDYAKKDFTSTNMRGLAYLEANKLVQVEGNILKITSAGTDAFNGATGNVGVDDLFRKARNATPEARAIRGYMFKNRKAINSIGRISTWKESKQDVIEELLNGTADTVGEKPTATQEYISGWKENKFGSSHEETSELLSILGNKDADPLLRSNSYRMLGMYQADNRARTLSVQQMMFDPAIRSRATVADILQAAEDMIKAKGEQRSNARRQIAMWLNESYNTVAKQSAQKFYFSINTGEEIYGAGKLSKGSYMEIQQLRASGLSEDTIDSLFSTNLEGLHERNLLSSFAQEGTLDPDKLSPVSREMLSQVFDSNPEARAERLRNLGVNVGEDAQYVGYKLSENGTDYRSVPISLLETNRTNRNIFGHKQEEALSTLEKARRNVIEADINHRKVQTLASKGTLEASINRLHEITVGSLKETLKETAKRESRYGTSLTARSIGDDQIDNLMRHLAENNQDNVMFLDEDVVSKQFYGVKHLEGYDAKFIDDVPGVDPKRFYRVKLNQRDNKESNQFLMGIFNREPAQGPYSSMPMHVIVDTQLKGSGDFGFHAKVNDEKVLGNKLLGVLAKLDYDADTTGFTLAMGLNDGQYNELKTVGEDLNRHGQDLYSLMRKLDPKRKGKGATISLLDPGVSDNLEAYLSDAFQKGTERKRSAGIATIINQEMNVALENAKGAQREKLLNARAILYGVTEATLKTSHLRTVDHAANGMAGLDSLNDLADKLKRKEVSGSQFKKAFQANLEDMFGLNGSNTLTNRESEMFRGATDMLSSAYSEAIDNGNHAHPLLSIRGFEIKGAGDIAEKVAAMEGSVGQAPGTRTGGMYSNEVTVNKEAATVATDTLEEATKGSREVYNSLREVFSRNKRPLGWAAAGLGGLFVYNAAKGSELRSDEMPSQKKATILPPKQSSKFYTNKKREDIMNKSRAYDVRARARTPGTDRQSIKNMIAGENGVVRADINYRTNQ